MTKNNLYTQICSSKSTKYEAKEIKKRRKIPEVEMGAKEVAMDGRKKRN